MQQSSGLLLAAGVRDLDDIHKFIMDQNTLSAALAFTFHIIFVQLRHLFSQATRL